MKSSSVRTKDSEGSEVSYASEQMTGGARDAAHMSVEAGANAASTGGKRAYHAVRTRMDLAENEQVIRTRRGMVGVSRENRWSKGPE